MGQNDLTLLAKPTPTTQYLTEETVFTVKITATTQIIKRTAPKNQPKPLPPSLLRTDNITLSDLKAGDEITVIAASDITGQTEFTASRIEVIEAK